MRQLLRLLLVAVTIPASVALAPIGAASADVGTVSFTTLAQDYQSFSAQFWTPRDQVTMQRTSDAAPDTGVYIQAYRNTTSEVFMFVAPAGRALTVGHYPSAVSAGGPMRPGDAGIRVPSCDPLDGTFDVLDIEMTPTGADRADIVYNVTCNNTSVQGEVAVNEPHAAADVLAIPRTIGFAPTYPTTVSDSRPLTYVNTGSTTLHPSGVQVTGGEASRFHVVSDGCTGQAVLPNGTCMVRVAFAPASGDPQSDTASLIVSDDSAEGSQTVALVGAPIPGHTSAYFVGEGNDPVIGPHSFTATAPAGTVNLSGTTDEVVASAPLPINPPGYYRYTVTIHPPTGESLGVGTYSNVAFDPSRGSGAGLEVSGPSDVTCTNTAVGSFTISQFDVGPSGRVLALSMTWEQRCDGRAAGSYGSLAWRADSAANPPPTGPGTPSDTFPPGGVYGVVAYGGYGTTTLTWKNPTDIDLAHVIVRMAPGLTPPSTPTSGSGVYSGTGTSVLVSHLTLGRSYAFSIWTEDTNGNLAGPWHQIYHGTRTLLSVPKIMPVGAWVQVVGRVVDADSGAGVSGALLRIYARQPGSTTWTLLRSDRTFTRGFLYVNIRVTGHPYIEAKFLGGPNHGGSVSAAKHPAMAVGLTTYFTGHISPGGTEKVWGSVLPNLAGHPIYLEREVGGVWHSFKSALLTRTSTYSFVFSLPKGNYTYRVVIPATSGYLSAGTYPFVVPVY